MNLTELAERNLEVLRQNPYPGRGLIIGMTERSVIVQVCWLMGRSPNSRNRVYVLGDETGLVRTQFADPNQGGDPSLVIYNAMRQRSGSDFVVSNGHQTDTSVEAGNGRFITAMGEWEYEPDAPNFTPRITGIVPALDISEGFTIAIVRRATPLGTACSREFYDEHYEPGYGRCVTTYRGDGNPLPSFEGEPYLLPLTGDYGQEIAEQLWNCLNEENRVALAVKMIDPTGEVKIHLINARELVSA